MDGNYKVVVESVPIQEPDAGGKLFSFSFPCSIFFFFILLYICSFHCCGENPENMTPK